MKYPKISIITPSYNQGQYLEETLVSVLDQNYPNLEYLVIDGGSNDNSVEIIKKYEKQLTYWVSEKDKGQSDAINKGLKRITGDLFNWLNSDDYLEPQSLQKVADAYLSNPDKRMFYFGLSHLKGTEKKQFSNANELSQPLLYYCDPIIKQQSTFYHKAAIKHVGPLNTHLHYCMDYEWWLKFMFEYGTDAIYENKESIAVFRLHPESKTSLEQEKFIKDIGNVLYSMAEQLNMKTYTTLLKKGISFRPEYHFNVPLNQQQVPLVKNMIHYFLLKWGHLIYTKEQFLFAKEFIKVTDFKDCLFSTKEKEWLSQLNDAVGSLNWNLFRTKRKLKWLMK